MRQALMASVAAAAVLAITGCGEKQPVTVYKQGQYQGKPDSRPWENAQFKSDKTAWETAIKARNNNQNEYSRTVSN